MLILWTDPVAKVLPRRFALRAPHFALGLASNQQCFLILHSRPSKCLNVQMSVGQHCKAGMWLLSRGDSLR